MRLELSGGVVIASTLREVWQSLLDPRFVAGSAPGVESVEVLDSTHFRVISGIGLGPIRSKLKLHGELLNIVPGSSATMRIRGKGAGSEIQVLTSIAVQDAGPEGGVRLRWSAVSELSGMVVKAGPRLIDGVARKFTEQFWEDFARRVETRR